MFDDTMRYAGFLKRCMAGALDILFLGLIGSIGIMLASLLQEYPFEVAKGHIAYGLDNFIIFLGYLEGFLVALFSGTSTLSLYWQEVTAAVPGDSFPSFGHLFKQFAWVVGGVSLYHALMEASLLQGSLGKYICGMKVLELDGARLRGRTAVWRNGLKFLSVIFLGAGYLSVFFSRKRQSFHDYLAGTLVVLSPQADLERSYPRWH